METIDPRFNEIGWGHLYDHPDWIVPCGQCGAEAGQPCDRRVGVVHSSRSDRAHRRVLRETNDMATEYERLALALDPNGALWRGTSAAHLCKEYGPHPLAWCFPLASRISSDYLCGDPGCDWCTEGRGWFDGTAHRYYRSRTCRKHAHRFVCTCTREEVAEERARTLESRTAPVWWDNCSRDDCGSKGFCDHEPDGAYDDYLDCDCGAVVALPVLGPQEYKEALEAFNREHENCSTQDEGEVAARTFLAAPPETRHLTIVSPDTPGPF